jgi:hypothetical protein
MKAITQIQQELKAPKSQYNSFGKYNYRNAEDIMEAVKPLLAKYDCSMYISDTIEEIGGRHYIKSTITFKPPVSNAPGNEPITITAYAREEETKKGMDGSQITGASSSYARKYALNGLFLIDDAKDSDYTNTHGKEEATPAQQEPAKQLLTPNHSNWNKVAEWLSKDGNTIGAIEKKYILPIDYRQELLSAAAKLMNK